MDNEQNTAVSGPSLSDLLGPELPAFFDDVTSTLSVSGTIPVPTLHVSPVTRVQLLQAPASHGPLCLLSLLNDGELATREEDELV